MSDGHTLAWRALVESLHPGEVFFNSSGHQGHILCFQEKISPYLFFLSVLLSYLVHLISNTRLGKSIQFP